MNKQEFDALLDGLDKPKFFNRKSYSYLTVMGSRAYNTHTEDSDYDFYGFIVPPEEYIFPHLKGFVSGFGNKFTPFEQLQHQKVPHNKYGEIDFTIYNIVKYFQLVMNGNPNMVDSLFVDETSILYMDNIGKIVRDNRKLFLSEKMFHMFGGMAYAHANRIKNGKPKEGRKGIVEEFGFDLKDSYHTIRILLEIKQVLETGDLDITVNKDYLKLIRSGRYDLDYILIQFDKLMYEIEYIVKEKKSKVPYSPDENRIKNVLIACLEEKYGSLSKFGFNLLLDRNFQIMV